MKTYDQNNAVRSLVTYGTGMSMETSIRYNHINAEAVQALTNIQIYLQAAEMQIDPQTTHGSKDIGRSSQTSQPPETVKLTKTTSWMLADKP